VAPRIGTKVAAGQSESTVAVTIKAVRRSRCACGHSGSTTAHGFGRSWSRSRTSGAQRICGTENARGSFPIALRFSFSRRFDPRIPKASHASAWRLASSISSDSPRDLYWCLPSRPRNRATQSIRASPKNSTRLPWPDAASEARAEEQPLAVALTGCNTCGRDLLLDHSRRAPAVLR